MRRSLSTQDSAVSSGETGSAASAAGDEGTAAVPDRDIVIPWPAIIDALPRELQTLVMRKPSSRVELSLPRQTVLDQLGQGAVVMTLGELRRQAPADTFAAPASAHDGKKVNLPLKSILSQIPASQLPRRADQRQIEVSNDIAAVFGPKGEQLKPPPPPPSQEPVSRPVSAPSKRAPGAKATEAAPEPSIPPPPPRQAQVELELEKPTGPIQPQIPLPDPTSLRGSAAAPVPTPAPASAGASTGSGGAGEDVLVIPTDRIKSVWPQAIRSVLPAAARLVLPLSELEPGLKEGKIEFTWKRLRLAVNPAVPADAASAEADTLLPLPLSVVAPLFVAGRQSTGRTRVKVDETIPPLFLTGKVPPSDAAVTRPAPLSEPLTESKPAPAPAPAPPPPPAPSPAAIPGAAPEIPAGDALKTAVNAMLGDPDKTTWSPGNLVDAVVTRFGEVTGSLITMQDGLLVAGRLPGGMDPENVAAFLPQAYHRIEEVFAELSAPAPGAITLDNGIVSLRVFKTGKVFFAALGNSGQPMPESQLQQIASYLSTHP